MDGLEASIWEDVRVELVFYDEQGSLTIEQDLILNLVV